jgi:hypothetical protein
MTMAYHIYDPVYCNVMMIAVCDMQSKGMEVQCMLWMKVNVIVEKKGMGTHVFKGLMVDNV